MHPRAASWTRSLITCAPSGLRWPSPTASRMAVLFTPIPLPEDRMSYVKQVEGLGRRVTVLWFTDGDPRESWDAAFAGAVEQSKESGVGKAEFVAPFIPTVVGTNKYVDELR